jgi:hypothetical protein
MRVIEIEFYSKLSERSLNEYVIPILHVNTDIEEKIEAVLPVLSACGTKNTVLSLTEDDIRAAKKKAKKARKNHNLAVRRQEKRREAKLKKSFPSEQPTSNSREIDVISTTEDFPSVPLSVPALPDIVAASDMVSIPDYGMTILATCFVPEMDVSDEQVKSSDAASESTEVHPYHTMPHQMDEKIESVLPVLSGGIENTVISPTEDDEIRAAKKKAKKAKKNFDLAARRREKRRVEKLKKSLPSEQPTASPSEIDVNGLQLHQGDFVVPSDLASDV